jgi:hydroxyacylglutathione hydrolase
VKTSRKVLLGIGIPVLILIMLFAFYMIKLSNEYKRFTPLATGQISSDLYVINDDFVNVFILYKNKQYMVIDSGNKRENIEKGFEYFGINISNVSTVLLTHTDYDHVAQVSLYKNAKFYISKDEEKMINGEVNRSPFMCNKLTVKYLLLPNNGVQKIGDWEVQTILLPGHTAGSVCYLIDDKYLFTGDSISLVNNQIMPFNDFFNMSTKQQIESIKNIANLNSVELVLTAHYGLSNHYKELFDTWIKKQKESN